MASRFRLVTFKVSPELLESVDLLASRLGVSRSELIRAALVRVLKRPPSRGELALASFFSSVAVGEGMPVGVLEDSFGDDGLLSGAGDPPPQSRLRGEGW